MAARDLIYFSPIPWRGLHQRPQHCADLLAAGRRLLFVEPVTLHGEAPPPREGDRDWLALPVLPVNARQSVLRGLALAGDALPPLRRAVEARQARLLARRCDRLGLREPVLLFGHPELSHLRRLFPDSPVVYDHMDDVLRFVPRPDRMRRILAALVAEADLVNATSRRLAEQMEALGAQRLLRQGNGVEWERFAVGVAPPPPPELASLPVPRAVYTGSVAEWFDLELLFEVARRLPDVSFPVVGPLRPSLLKRVERAPANLRFIGQRPYAQVPAWLAGAQAALIPFVRNALTEAVDPVKLYEYLAAGLPVVATPFSPELADLAGGVFLAETAEAFAAALRRVLDAPPPPGRLRELAAPRRWERVLAPLVEAIEAL
ncbi:MAG: glycosyltransferase [Candidatus Krumholzibacteriota bacterium]|nr:glycosyltransferase [Candidatus Krumholzibacteriota bacterium]